MNIKIVKLFNGEELIGEYNEKTSVIKNPVVMIPVNKEQIAFQPWLPYAEDKEYSIKKEHIVITATPTSTILNEYNRAFGSGLVVPSAKSTIIT